MLTMKELIEQVESLSTAEKWQVVKLLLRSLEHEQSTLPATDWHEFLRETYGSLKDTPLKRWGQG
jgi:hypothetical protein